MRDERGPGGEADDAVSVCGNYWRGDDVCVYGAGGGAVFVWRGLGRLYKRRRGIGRCGEAIFQAIEATRVVLGG